MPFEGDEIEWRDHSFNWSRLIEMMIVFGIIVIIVIPAFVDARNESNEIVAREHGLIQVLTIIKVDNPAQPFCLSFKECPGQWNLSPQSRAILKGKDVGDTITCCVWRREGKRTLFALPA